MSYPDEDFGQELDMELDMEEVVPTATAVGQYTVPWTWSANSLLWIAGGVLAVGFGVWFLMSFNAAKARSLVEVVTDNANA